MTPVVPARVATSPLVVTLAAALLVVAAGCGGGSDGPYTLKKEIAIQVTPTQIVFPIVAIGQSEQRTIEIHSVGEGGPLVISKLSLTTDTSDEFSFVAPEKLSLQSGEMTTVVVRYQPDDNDQDQGRLRIEHNATGVGDILVDLLALEQRPKLLFEPSPAQFGAIRAETPATKQIRVQNIGADDALVTGLSWNEGSSPDFEITEEPSYPATIAPGDDVFFTVTYTPHEGDADSGEVIAHYTNPDGDGYEDRVRISGHEVAPDILVSPGAVDFGSVPLDTRHTRPVAIVNEGSDTLVVQPPAIDFEHEAISLEDVFEQAVELEPGASIGFVVAFEATVAFPFTTEPLLRIRVESNDPNEHPVLVPVYANIEKPEIRVTPQDVIDFGIVAQNFTARRSLTIFNAGQLPLEVTELRLVDDQGALAGEYTMKADAAFPPTSGAGGGVGVVQPNEAREIEFAFQNLGPESGEAWASVTVVSNDMTTPEATVNLRARRGGAPTCEVVLEPGTYDYGTVPIGASKEAIIRIRNVGSGNCGFNRASVSKCSTSMFPGFPAGCTLGTTSDEFEVVGTPIPTPDGIPPGGTADVRVRYEPPRQLSLFDFNEYSGFLQITLYNPYGPGGDSNLFKVPPDPATGAPQPNLMGRSGISRVSVLPDHIDFGLVTLGCYSQTHKVSVYNSGTAPLFVTAIEPGPGCSAEFVIEAPPIPPDGIEVTTATPLVIEVKYHAQTLGPQNCSLIIRSSDTSAPVISVPMTGEGTLESHQIDIFQQVAGQEVDILFVVDDSGSMCEEQDRLRDNLNDFIQHAQTWDNDYQIGVVSTCVQGSDVCEGAGELKSNFYEAPDWERWVTNVTWPHFTSNVDLGCNGGSDSQEAALEAAHMALSLPISHMSDQTCGSNAQCQAPDKCLAGLAKCGGFNGGFLRDDAALEIVVLSDEEDQSPATPDFYVDFFKSIKGFANENFFHFHSIVGDKDRGCGDSSSSGSGTTASAGDRYIYVSEATGGIVESICNDSFAEALSEIGSIAFGLKVQFFLSRAGDPSTIQVTVAGVQCTQGWLYDPPSNSVIFDEHGPCMPQDGDEIRIEYDAICYTN